MMKKIYQLMVLLLLSANFASAQSWTVYEADVDPLTFDPAFEASNQSDNFTSSIIADPDNGDNNLLQITSSDDADGDNDNVQWRRPLETNENITVVIKAKANDETKPLVFDMDFDFRTEGAVKRWQLRILTDGTFDVANGTGEDGSLGAGFNPFAWNTYRFVWKNGGTETALYVNESIEPVYQGAGEDRDPGSQSYFRFGDGWGSGYVDTSFDWAIWDNTGAYSPSEGALPVGLVETSSANWTIYQADVDPLSFDPAFEASNQSDNFTSGIIADPDNGDNNILHITSTDDADGDNDNVQWRRPLETNENITVVVKAKANDNSKNLVFDIDFDFRTEGALKRWQLRILADGTFDVANGTGEDGSLGAGFDPYSWNIYRFVWKNGGSETALYVNEGTDPVYQGAGENRDPGSQNYFRFGDGWGSGYVDTHFDWVLWDDSGAYSPEEGALPNSLTEIAVGDWTTYHADVDPLSFDPAFEASNQSDNFMSTIIDDTERSGNKLLHMTTTDDADSDNDNAQWRRPLESNENVTVILKAKANDESKNLVFDIDFDFRTEGAVKRWQLRILTDGTFDVANGTGEDGSLGAGFDPFAWNTYRFVWKNGGTETALYVNESTEPVYQGAGEDRDPGSQSYFRFGDGWGSGYIDTHIDWVVWDVTGGYSPSQTRLPDDLVKSPQGEWTVYEADTEPLSFDPAFEASNQSDNFTSTIIEDSDDSSNNLLHMTTTDDADGDNDNAQWRRPLESNQNVTVVLKAKANDESKNLVFDIDFDFRTEGAVKRWQLRILTDGTFDVANGTGEDGSLGAGFDPFAWNTYRFVWKNGGTETALYVNESTEPVYQGAGEDRDPGSQSYFRFGDGWGSGYIDTHIDWVIWDVTGGYSPYQTRIPDHLSGEDSSEATPIMSATGTVDPLTQDIGFASDFSVDSYTLEALDLTSDVTVTPPANFEVSLDESSWFTNASPLTISSVAGEVEATTIYVRLNASADGEYSGDIVHSSDGAENVTVSVSGTAVTLIPGITFVSTMTAFSQNISTPSVAQTFRVSGENLKSAITVTAPANFEVSSDGATWASSANFEPTDRTLINATVHVRLNASALGSYSGDITCSSTDATDITVAVSGETIPDPGIEVAGELTAFSHNVGTPSDVQSYTVSGSNLASDIVATAPDGYEVSFNGELWLPYLTLVAIEGNVQTLTVFVRLNATAEGSYDGNIVHSSDGVDDANIAVTGTVTDIPLSVDDVVSFELWPNPATDLVKLNRTDLVSDARILVYGLNGKVVSSSLVSAGQKELTLDVSSLQNGLYTVEYISATEHRTMRLLKK